MTRPKRVIVADDSTFVRGLIESYLESTDEFDVVASAANGAEAVAMVQRYRPDAITLDLEMPEVDGLEALRRIMRLCPTPAIMVSGVSQDAAKATLNAIHSGAVDFILKYVPGETVDPATLRCDLISKLRAAANVKVIRSLGRIGEEGPKSTRQAKARAGAGSGANLTDVVVTTCPTSRRDPDYPADTLKDVIVIGASTGGPVAIRELISEFPADFLAAIVVVQHIPASFTDVMSAQLDRHVSLNVQVARHGDRLCAGKVLVAPGGEHLMIAADGTIRIAGGLSVCGHRPSIDVAMQSIAHCFHGRVWGVLLTGMGDDGAAGLSYIRAKGGTTFAQNAESCVVNGMPQKAIDMEAVSEAAPPRAIGRRLAQLIERPTGTQTSIPRPKFLSYDRMISSQL